MRSDVKIAIENVRRIEYCVVEGIDLDPRQYFRLRNGQFVADLPNFPINNREIEGEASEDLDVLIVVTGNPRTDADMFVTIDERKPAQYRLFKPFNKNGYGQFNVSVPV